MASENKEMDICIRVYYIWIYRPGGATVGSGKWMDGVRSLVFIWIIFMDWSWDVYRLYACPLCLRFQDVGQLGHIVHIPHYWDTRACVCCVYECEWSERVLCIRFVMARAGMFHNKYVHLDSYLLVTLYAANHINITKYCNNLVLSFLLDFPSWLLSTYQLHPSSMFGVLLQL